MAEPNNGVVLGPESEAQMRAFLDSLALVMAGKTDHDLEIEFEATVLQEMQATVNALVRRLDKLAKRVDHSNRFNIDINLGISECEKALREVREGNLHARVGEAVLSSDSELISSLGSSLNEGLDEIQSQIETIRSQQMVIEELSTPILEVWDDVIVLPVIGVVDTRRAVDIMERLLAEIVDRRAQFLILDITGVEVVDTKTADHFIKLLKAAELLGATCVLTGIRPAVAQTLVEIGMDLSSVTTLRNLRAGLRECLRLKGAQARLG